MQQLSQYIYLLLLSSAFVVFSGDYANAQASSYEQLQAAYLYNFAKYIKWPEESESFNIGVFSHDKNKLNTISQIMKDKKVRGKPIKINGIDKIDSLSYYHIVYLPVEESKELEHIIEIVKTKNILVVTERDLIKRGATISFVVDDNKVRFKLSKQKLQDAGLVASEGLLQIALVQ